MSERRLTLLLLPGLVAALLLAVATGPFGLSPGQITAILLGDRSDPQAVTVLMNIRLPRVLAAALVGAALASAGAAYQTVFRNPLVSPDILGVSAGAGFGAVLGILLGLPVMVIQMLGFGMGLATVALVLGLSLALRGTGQVLVMVLCGIAVGALAGAGIALVKLLADPEQQLPAITFWLMGSLAGIKRPDIAAALPAVLVGLAPLLALRWRIGLLALGEDEARAMGVEAGRLRLLVIACATLMTSAAVAMAGVIGWVGLMVPHMARLLTGPRFDRLLPVSLLIGAGFMVLVDTAARSIAVIEVPLGILTAVLGAPVFVALLARGARGVERVTPLLETRGLAVGHGGKALVQGLAIRLMPGCVLCVLGPNGAGKTTLFRSLLGLIPPVSGQVFLGGEALARLSRARIAARLAHVPQALATPFAFTALDIVLMGAAARLGVLARPGPAETARAMAALQRLGIADLAEAPIARLSGGQCQLVLIARALAQDAAALILDEPTASLDFANRRQVGQAIRALADSGRGIILSSHDPDQAAALADQVLLMGRQGVLGQGAPEPTMTADALSRLYGMPIARERTAGGRLHFH